MLGGWGSEGVGWVVSDPPPPGDTSNATPQTQSEGDNALNPVEAARLLPHPGTRDGTNCKALSE